uniref:Uncharacterized protein n=1 Tax=Octopus bimaculoides TaxID=37653 RepID=A0A0L8FXD0_OCTBM
MQGLKYKGSNPIFNPRMITSLGSVNFLYVRNLTVELSLNLMVEANYNRSGQDKKGTSSRTHVTREGIYATVCIAWLPEVSVVE